MRRCRRWCASLKNAAARRGRAAATTRQRGSAGRANGRRASGSIGCSTTRRRFWNSRRSPPAGCMTAPHPAPGLSPASGGLPDARCSSSRTTRPSRGAPISRSPYASTCAHSRSRRKTGCPASIWWIRAALIFRCRPRYFPTGSTSAGSSTTRPGCRRPESPRSRSSWVRARPAAPTSRPCRIRRSSCGTRGPSSSAARPS